MSNSNQIEIPDNMLFFYRACSMLYNVDAVCENLAKEITDAYGYSPDEIKSIHKWIRRLPQSVIDETLGADRFDLFNTKVMELLLYDVSISTAKRLKEKISKAEDINSLSSSLGTLLGRLDKLEDKYLANRLQGIRGGTTKSPIESLRDLPKPDLKIA